MDGSAGSSLVPYLAGLSLWSSKAERAAGRLLQAGTTDGSFMGERRFGFWSTVKKPMVIEYSFIGWTEASEQFYCVI